MADWRTNQPSSAGVPPQQAPGMYPPPPAAPQPEPAAPSRKGGAIGGAALALAAIALALAVVGMVMFPGPKGDTGAAGTNGINGTSGTNGINGVDGAQGPKGDKGNPGTNGTDGAQGPRGPPGNGTLMNSSESIALFTTIGSVCTYSGANVTITVPTSGTVVVSGVTRLRFNHVTGTEDRWVITISDSETTCPALAFSWLDSIPPGEATDTQVWMSAFTQNVFPVTAGTHTFSMTGWMVNGQDAADVWIFVGLVAVFYPS